MKEEYVYKYISFEQFVDLVENERLYLTRIDLWEDCWEGIYIKKLLEYSIEKSITTFKRRASLKKYNEYLYQIIKKCTYGQSWTKRKEESDAMWRIYSSQKTGVRIKVNIENIKNCISNSIKNIQNLNPKNQEVKYEEPNYEMYIKDGKCYYDDLLYYKRKEFGHEEEYRFSVSLNETEEMIKTRDDNQLEKEQLICDLARLMETEKSIYYTIPNEYIEEILLDPRATNYFEETFMTYCNKRNLRNHRKSKLYTIK